MNFNKKSEKEDFYHFLKENKYTKMEIIYFDEHSSSERDIIAKNSGVLETYKRVIFELID